MLMRANFAGALVLVLMASVRHVEALVALRLVQGAFTGTVTAAQTMVAAATPNHRSGFALGALSAAVFSGMMAGAFFGGWFADGFGYRATFVAAGLLIGLAGLLVLFFTHEEFTPPTLDDDHRVPPPWSWRGLGAGLPILALIAVMAGTRQFDMALLPLLVQDIHGSVAGASRWTGLLFAVASVGGLLAGPVFGHWADRAAPAGIARVCAIGAAVMMIPQGLAHAFGLLVPARFAMMFFAGGLDPVFQIWLAKITPPDRHGVVFGWSSTARSLGWFAAPLLSGLLAAALGLRAIYFVNAALFLALLPLIQGVTARVALSAKGSTTR